MPNVRVTFRDPSFQRFLLVPGNTPLAATKTENGTTVTVPHLDIHCLVVAER